MTVVEAAYVQRRTRGGGGVAGRRAVTRWAWRMFRREWRQQIVVLVLLSVTVAAAVVRGDRCLQPPTLRVGRVRQRRPPDHTLRL